MNGRTTAILSRAARILSVPGSWTQGILARDSMRRAVNPESPSAVCFCTIGAINAATAQLSSPLDSAKDIENRSDSAVMELYETLSARGIESSVTTWNDTLGRTRTQVLELITDTLARA